MKKILSMLLALMVICFVCASCDIETSGTTADTQITIKNAATYNNYILENEYVWSNNVPKDIDYQLPFLV